MEMCWREKLYDIVDYEQKSILLLGIHFATKERLLKSSLIKDQINVFTIDQINFFINDLMGKEKKKKKKAIFKCLSQSPPIRKLFQDFKE